MSHNLTCKNNESKCFAFQVALSHLEHFLSVLKTPWLWDGGPCILGPAFFTLWNFSHFFFNFPHNSKFKASCFLPYYFRPQILWSSSLLRPLKISFDLPLMIFKYLTLAPPHCELTFWNIKTTTQQKSCHEAPPQLLPQGRKFSTA